MPDILYCQSPNETSYLSTNTIGNDQLFALQAELLPIQLDACSPQSANEEGIEKFDPLAKTLGSGFAVSMGVIANLNASKP